jgi:protein arginine kinase activator
MLCQECKKRPATVHLMKIVNNHKTELFLCEECAGRQEDFMQMPSFSISDLIAGFMETGKPHQAFEKPAQSRCKVCGMDYSQFKKAGRFGCQECYKYFDSELIPLLRKIHGNYHHSGKVPRKTGTDFLKKRQIAQYKSELKKAIEVEAYERAAELRDMIKALEESYGGQGGDNNELAE